MTDLKSSRQKKGHLTQEEVDKILELYKKDPCTSRVARALGITKMTVRNHTQPDWKIKHRKGIVARNRSYKVHARDNEGKHKNFYTVKRPRPYTCELCEGLLKDQGNDKRIYWHHWDDIDPSKGIWVCFRCHRFCEAIEHGLTVEHFNRYLGLRKEFNGNGDNPSEL